MQGHIINTAASGGSGGSSPMFLILIVLMVGAFYFLLIRPQKARQKQQQEMQRTLEPGTRVMTTSGMFAHVVEVTDDGVVLEIAPGVEAEFVNQAIMKVVPEEPVEDETEEAAEEPVAEAAPAETAAPAEKAEAVQAVEAKTDIDAKDEVADKVPGTADKTAGKTSEKPSA